MKHALISTALLLAACGQAASDAPNNSYGPNPELPAPSGGLIPTVNTAHPVGWAANAAPQAPAGFTVMRFAERLNHPRALFTLPNGDVLVAQASTQPDTGGGIGGWIKNSIQRGAGAFADNANSIILLRDADHDGRAESRFVFADHLNQPFGMALIGDAFYVANTDSVVRYHYALGATHVDGAGEPIMRIPTHAGDNGHWTRTLAVSPDGTKLFLSVGSSSNLADYGMEVERGRAAIWVMNPDGSDAHIYASGLRNPAGLEFDPHSGELWTAVNERDMLGDNLTPDYMTHVQEGGFYGWPYSYWGQHVDTRMQPQNPALVATALTPDFALGAHTASLGLHFYRGTALPQRYRDGAFVGQHGSWNRSQLVGYKVVFVPFENGRPTGAIEDFLTGFLNARNEAQGRPVGVGEDATGAILVADDVGNIIWRVAPSAP